MLSRRRFLSPLLLAPALLCLWIGGLQVSVAGDGPSPATLYPPSVVESAINAVTTADLEIHVCHLQDKDALGYCNTQGSRFSFNPGGLVEAANYITSQFQTAGLAVTTQTFEPPWTPPDVATPAVLTNVVGTLEGLAPPSQRGVVIVSAHYDSTAGNTAGWDEFSDLAPGADDNGSGVATVLEAARLLSEHQFWHTVRFVTFSGEEQGLWGSHYYADQAWQAGENIIAVVNADMVAYNGDDEPRLEVHAGPDPENLAIARTVTQTIQDYGLDLQPQVVSQNPIRLSDHASFWDRGYPGVLIIEDTDLTGPTSDFNPYYHTVEDTLDKTDRSYFKDMVRGVVGTVTRLAEPVAPDLQVAQRGPDVVRLGQTVTFTLAYSNPGTAPAAGVVLTDTLSNGLLYQSDSSGVARSFDVAGHVIWELGELGEGDRDSFVVTATVGTGLREGMLVRSQATIAGRELDADGVDNVSVLEATIRDKWRLHLPLVLAAAGH